MRPGYRRAGWIRRAVALTSALALAAAACGDDKDSSPSDSGGTGTTRTATATTAAPQTGGTLVFGAYSHISGLDPLVALGSGTSGGIQMSAVYDTLMRYDLDAKQYKPHMLESLAPNADSTEYTLKIRAGIKFSDGTDFDAEAVRFALNRHRVGSATLPATECAAYIACPRNARSSAVYMALVKDIVAVDKLTVRVTLNEPWTSFAYALASEPGMIPSPTALKKCDGTKNPNTCDFNLKPVGAGPFTVSAFKPNEIIEMVRNPNYFGGQVYLDGLNFVAFLDLGGEKTYDAFKTGTVQGAYLRVPTAVAAAKADKVPGLSLVDQAGETILLNEGVNVTCADGKPEPLCVGKPNGPTPTTPATAKLKVRQAILAAYDPKTFNERVYQGKGLVDTSLFQKSFPWDPGIAGPKYDLEAAKRLVNEAKAEGWNGSVRLLMTNSALDANAALALEAMLKAAGMNPIVDTGKDSTAQQATVITSKDFDMSRWGTAIGPDDSALWSVALALLSTSPSNFIGFKSDAVDQAVKDLRVAKSDDQRKAAYKTIAEQYNAQLPWITLAAIETLKIFSPKVNGVAPGLRNFVYFEKAWIAK